MNSLKKCKLSMVVIGSLVGALVGGMVSYADTVIPDNEVWFQKEIYLAGDGVHKGNERIGKLDMSTMTDDISLQLGETLYIAGKNRECIRLENGVIPRDLGGVHIIWHPYYEVPGTDMHYIKQSIAKLEIEYADGTMGYGTGTLIGQDTLITSIRLFKELNEGTLGFTDKEVKNIEVIFMINGNECKFSCNMDNVNLSQIEELRKLEEFNDAYAFITLDECIGLKTGFMFFGNWPDNIRYIYEQSEVGLIETVRNIRHEGSIVIYDGALDGKYSLGAPALTLHVNDNGDGVEYSIGGINQGSLGGTNIISPFMGEAEREATIKKYFTYVPSDLADPDLLERVDPETEELVYGFKGYNPTGEIANIPELEAYPTLEQKMTYPYSAICKIEVTFEKDGEQIHQYGTGTLIGPNTIITAAHVVGARESDIGKAFKENIEKPFSDYINLDATSVIDSLMHGNIRGKETYLWDTPNFNVVTKNKYFKELRVEFGFNTDTQLDNKSYIISNDNIIIYPGFFNITSDRAYDFALLKLNNNIGYALGWVGISDKLLYPSTYEISGYPAYALYDDLDTDERQKLVWVSTFRKSALEYSGYTSFNPVIYISDTRKNQYEHNILTYQGMSGALLMTQSKYGKDFRASGVFKGVKDDTISLPSCSCIINNNILRWIINNGPEVKNIE